MENQKKLSWNCIENYIDLIANQIKERKISFDCIISVGRGGLVPTRLLSDRLSINTVYFYPVHFYKGVFKTDTKPTAGVFSHNISGKNVLLADDIYHTGKTIETVLERLKLNKASRMAVATLLVRKDAPGRPSFFGKEISSEHWIVFPWEKEEFKETDE